MNKLFKSLWFAALFTSCASAPEESDRHFTKEEEDSLLVGDYLFVAKGHTKHSQFNGTVERPVQIPPNGSYIYDIAFAEWEGKSLGAKCTVVISGNSIRIIYDGIGNLTASKGDVLDEGTILKHKKTGEWIIAHDPSDQDAVEVGGCSDGPSVIDFKNKLFWLC